MAKLIRRISWDTSIFLCFLGIGEELRRKICEDILQHAADGKIRLFTSTYTIAEVIRPKKKSIPNSRKLTTEEIAKISAMFRWPFLTTIELDPRTAFFAADLARDHGLLPADSVHAASAILWKMDALQAWDRDFGAVSQLINIEQPAFMTTQPRFEGLALPRIGPAPEDFEEK
jgi:predicted nucleic acid-binding protein